MKNCKKHIVYFNQGFLCNNYLSIVLFFFLILLQTKLYSQPWISINTSYNSCIYEHHFVNSNLGWFITESYNNSLFKTTDGGYSWNEQIVPMYSYHSYEISSIYFQDSLNGVICGSYYSPHTGAILISNDGGNNWDIKYLSQSTSEYLLDIKWDNIIIFVKTNNGKLLRSSDTGNTWLSINTPIYYIVTDYLYYNSETIYLSAIDILDVVSYFAKTTNGGNTWLKTEFPDLYYANSIFFINPNVGWICGRLGKIKKTTDGGNTWFDCYAGVDDWLQDIVFYDENNGWLVTDKGRIMRTYNGGQNWVTEFQSDTSLNNISLTPDGYLFASGCNGRIYKSAVNLSNILESNKHFHVYPNPASITLTVIAGIQNQTESRIELYDMRGKRVLATTTCQSETTVNVSFLPSGVYSCTVSNEKYRETVKVVKL